MNTPTTEEVEEIRKRLRKADSGPWDEEFLKVLLRYGRKYPSNFDTPGELPGIHERNAEFIAHAQQDIERLFLYIDQLLLLLDIASRN